jgi:TonB family protein
MRSIRVLPAVLCCLFAWAPTAPAASITELKARLQRAEALDSLDDPSMHPWHLKLSYQLFDEKGQPTEQGTVEEWWQSPTSHKTVYTSPSYNATEVQTSEGLFRTKQTAPPPYLVTHVLKEVVHPLDPSDILDATPNLHQETIANIPLDCIMMSQVIQDSGTLPLGLFPTLCLDRDKDSLRLSVNFGSQMTVRNGIGSFQQRMVPVKQATTENSVNVVTAQIATLRSESLPAGELVPSADLEKRDAYEEVPSGVMQGKAINHPLPVYPEVAKVNHFSGQVVFLATIGTDGHIHALKVIHSANTALVVAAVSGVRQWTYTPYTLNGVPVDVRTTITVNFNMKIER